MTANEAISPASGSDQHQYLGSDTRWTLADKINHLFATVLRPDGSRYSNDEVAARMSSLAGGPQISGAYLSLLRRGIRDNPTKRHLEALAEFFSQSPAYFFDDAASKAIADELHLLRILADSGVKRIATRLGGLSHDGLRNIANIIEHVRQIEGLDTRGEGTDDDE